MNLAENNQPAAVATTAAGVSRLALGIEYNGSRYHGFQRQQNDLPTVQTELEQALSQVAGGLPVQVSCAGRTDAGVHACAQVVHFDAPVLRSHSGWLFGSNRYLPKDISVLWVAEVSADFDARFSAMRRRYRYVIYSHPVRPALLSDGVTWTFKELDVQAMNQAAQLLLGTHDFSSFRAAECQARSPVKTLDGICLTQHGRYIVLDVRASAFLHHMVRNIAGTLMSIGAGEKPVSWMADVLAARNRKQAGVTAPPYGLYMVGVEYPSQFALPVAEPGPHFLAGLPDVFAELP